MSDNKELKKLSYRGAPNGTEIKGLDLHIDANTQKLCETYNLSSGATRSVLYLLLIISVISLISVFNSNWKFNWAQDRLGLSSIQISLLQDKLHEITSHKHYRFHDSVTIANSIEAAKLKRDDLIHADIDDNYIIKATFIGVSLDVNDLGPILGLTMVILLTVLRFTLTREKNNLKIALHSVTERYDEGADFPSFKELIDKQVSVGLPDHHTNLNTVVADINFIRRRYHYNFLSMNDVFNLPLLDTSENKLQRTIMGKLANNYLFFFFLVVNSYILFNDFCSFRDGWATNRDHTGLSIGFSILFYIFNFNMSKKCIEQKQTVVRLFNRFWENKYQYDYYDYDVKSLKFIYKILIPIGLILCLLVLREVVMNIPFFEP